MLLLLVVGMLVVLVVLEELVVFVEGILKVLYFQKKCENFIESKKTILGAKKSKKSLTRSKIHLYFKVLHSSIPL